MGAKTCFEAIGGDFTAVIVKNMPKDSIITVYGCLSQKNISVPTTYFEMQVLYHFSCNKKIAVMRTMTTTHKSKLFIIQILNSSRK